MDKKINFESKRKTNLDDEIYFLTYAMPLYKDQISIKLYNERGNPTIIRKIKELKEKGWVYVSEINKLPKHHKEWVLDNLDESDKRYRLRKYVYANPDIIFLRISKILESHGDEYTLSRDEKKQLKGYLTSEKFMMTIQRFVLFKFWREDGIRIDEPCSQVDIKNIFSTFINIILMDVVSHLETIKLYTISLWETYPKLASWKDTEGFYIDVLENYDKYKPMFDADLHPILAKKLYCLDFHFADSLSSYFEIYRSYSNESKLLIKELREKKKNNENMVINFDTLVNHRREWLGSLDNEKFKKIARKRTRKRLYKVFDKYIN